MPTFIGAFIELIEQARAGKQLDKHCKTLRRWMVAEPLKLVPRSVRPQAEVNLRVGEYLAAIGSGKPIDETTVKKLANDIEEAKVKAETEARTKLKRDREALQSQPATKLDVAQLAVDLLALGRAWTDHFNEWSAGQKEAMEERLAQQEAEITRLRHEITEIRQQQARRTPT